MSGRPTIPHMSSDDDEGHTSSDEELTSIMDQLTRKQVLEIESTFDKHAQELQEREGGSSRPAHKRQKVETTDYKGKGRAMEPEEEQAPGGFFVDDDADMGGGFMPEEDDSTSNIKTTPKYNYSDNVDEDSYSDAHTSGRLPTSPAKKVKYIPLDDIPDLLLHLHLDWDDPGVTETFMNAAEEDKGTGIEVVSRKNYIKIVAILVAARDSVAAGGEADYGTGGTDDTKHRRSPVRRQRGGARVHSGGGKRRAIRLDVPDDQSDHDDSDPLVLSSQDEDDEDAYDHVNAEDSDPWADEDEIEGAFTGGSSPPLTRRTTRSRRGDGDEDSDFKSVASSTKKAPKGKGPSTSYSATAAPKDKQYKLSSKQKEECERMFQQFFSSTDSSKNRSISIPEIRYVATLLNEKISDADIHEMLEFASTSNDKRVDLEAFSKIMAEVKAV